MYGSLQPAPDPLCIMPEASFSAGGLFHFAYHQAGNKPPSISRCVPGKGPLASKSFVMHTEQQNGRGVL